MEQGKAPKFKTVEFKTIPLTDLQPHPEAEKIGMDDEDALSMVESVAELGVMDALKVIRHSHGYQIIDGVNRWKTIKKTGAAEMLCQVVEVEDAKQIVMACLASGRKRTTGQRILAYLEEHKEPVLKVAEIVRDVDQRVSRIPFYSQPAGHATGREISGDLQYFTAEAIAKRKGISDKDVRLGIELLLCLEKRITHQSHYLAAQDGGKPATEEYMAEITKVKNSILQGSAPIRRWKASVAGKMTAEGAAREKEEAKYGKHAAAWCRSLTNALIHWADFTNNERGNLRMVFRELVASLPRDLHGLFRDGIDQWSTHDREMLVSSVKKTLEKERKTTR